jgi:hypothetical protein
VFFYSLGDDSIAEYTQKGKEFLSHTVKKG